VKGGIHSGINHKAVKKSGISTTEIKKGVDPDDFE
jgi:hypothetical protein